jgi:hypothetical protein
MVEVHAALRKGLSAIAAWHRSELVKEICVAPPPLSLGRRSSAGRQFALSESVAMLPPGSNAMTVHADDVAFRHLGEQRFATLQCNPRGADGEGLGERLAVVEVHLMGLKAPAAVTTGDVSQLAQEVHRCLLAPSNPIDFLLPVGRVVGLVGGALVALLGHSSL